MNRRGANGNGAGNGECWKNNWCFIFARSFSLKHKPSIGTTCKRKVNTDKK